MDSMYPCSRSFYVHAKFGAVHILWHVFITFKWKQVKPYRWIAVFHCGCFFLVWYLWVDCWLSVENMYPLTPLNTLPNFKHISSRNMQILSRNTNRKVPVASYCLCCNSFCLRVLQSILIMKTNWLPGNIEISQASWLPRCQMIQ